MPPKSFGLTLSRIRRKIFRNYREVRLVVGVGITALAIGLILLITAPLLRISKDFIFGPVNVFSILMPQRQEIKSTDGRTNILLLGTGGAQHDGPDLSDTMIVLSIKSVLEDKNKSLPPIVLISIPRDIYLDSLKGKINTAYATGQEKSLGTGLILAKGATTEVTGLPIHYAIRVDFSAFEKIIDLLGGIDINVEEALVDNFYPTTGKEEDSCGHSPAEIHDFMATASSEQQQWHFFSCRYEQLSFPAGNTHMNGVTALKFVRSRHAMGDQGTDFARAKRQQLLISAVKNKVFSTQTLLNPQKIEEIYNVLKANVDTDIAPSEINNFLQLALKYRGGEFKNVVLGLDQLENPPVDERGWILVPKGGIWDQIHTYIRSELK